MEKEFYSKKNKVKLIDGLVVKTFEDIEKLRQEKKINQILKKNEIQVPQIISLEENTIIYEFIEGKVYADIIEELGKAQICSIIKWINDFNKVIGRNHPDINLRNFIYNEDRGCVGLDFEEEAKSSGNKIYIEKDIGKMIAFICTYDPVFTRKKLEISKNFIENSVEICNEIDMKIIKKHYEEEIEDMIKRRAETTFSLEEGRVFIKNVLE